MTSEGLSLTVRADVGAPELTLTSAAELRYYLHQSDCPVLEARIDRPCTLFTEIQF